MARRKRRGGFKTRTRTVYKKAKRTYRRNKNTLIDFGSVATAGLYGALRSKISDMNPIKNYLGGFGTYADEAGMIIGGLVAKKFIKNPMAKKFIDKGLIVESAMLGSQMASGVLGGSTKVSNGANNSNVRVY